MGYKCKATAKTFVVLLCCVGAVAQSKSSSEHSPNEPQPTLVETERWITQTFQEDDNTGRANCDEFDRNVPGSEYGPSFYCSYEHYALDMKGCSATLTITNSHRTDADLERDIRDAKDDTVLSFDLRNVDPSSIRAKEPTGTFGSLAKKTFHLNNPEIEVDFRTTDDADTMALSFPNGHDSATQIKKHECCGYFGWGIYMTPDYATRFMKAFRHAVELCGGKPSAF